MFFIFNLLKFKLYREVYEIYFHTYIYIYTHIHIKVLFFVKYSWKELCPACHVVFIVTKQALAFLHDIFAIDSVILATLWYSID